VASQTSREQSGSGRAGPGRDSDRGSSGTILGLVAVAWVALSVVLLLWSQRVLAVIAVVVALAAVVAWIITRSRRDEVWANPDLFLPSSDPLLLGADVIARYRCRARRRGAVVAGLDARLLCEEVLVRRAQPSLTELVGTYPIEVDDYSTDDLIEVDLHIQVPVFEAPPTFESPRARIGWVVEVTVTDVDGERENTRVPVVVGAAVAV